MITRRSALLGATLLPFGTRAAQDDRYLLQDCTPGLTGKLTSS